MIGFLFCMVMFTANSCDTTTSKTKTEKDIDLLNAMEKPIILFAKDKYADNIVLKDGNSKLYFVENPGKFIEVLVKDRSVGSVIIEKGEEFVTTKAVKDTINEVIEPPFEDTIQ